MFENVVCEMLFISSRPQCVNTTMATYPIWHLRYHRTGKWSDFLSVILDLQLSIMQAVLAILTQARETMTLDLLNISETALLLCCHMGPVDGVIWSVPSNWELGKASKCSSLYSSKCNIFVCFQIQVTKNFKMTHSKSLNPWTQLHPHMKCMCSAYWLVECHMV